MLYGFPGSGKTYFARNLAESANIVHLQSDRIRHELFKNPSYTEREDAAVQSIMNYMTEELLKAGVSVTYDTYVGKRPYRRAAKELAAKSKAATLLVWLQVDNKSAMLRATQRDRRKTDDKYAFSFDKGTFNQYLASLQNPTNEDYIVISGKHSFNTQRDAVMKRLYNLGLLDSNEVASGAVKPGLINLIPNPLGGRVDNSRRNISIR